VIKRIWWTVKIGLFPHLEQRTAKTQVVTERRRQKKKLHQAESMLDDAIMDLTDALESKQK
jgi:hypothetical protein